MVIGSSPFKTCSECKRTMPLSAFYRPKTNNRCRGCVRNYKRQWKKAKKEGHKVKLGRPRVKAHQHYEEKQRIEWLLAVEAADKKFADAMQGRRFDAG